MNVKPHHRNAVLGMAVLAAAGLLVAGCGSSSSGTGSKTTSTNSATSGAVASTGTTKVTTGTVAGLGPVLETGQGMVLYVYTPDGTSGVTCTGGCASTWPSLMSSGKTATASGAAKASLLGSTADPAGGAVVTYAGRPLYTDVGDTSAGTANGQGTGGIWFVVAPSGTVVKSGTSAGGGSSTSPTSTGSAGGAYGGY
jgi:predicted lipoprotein with Yx(FWY)xxD motif